MLVLTLLWLAIAIVIGAIAAARRSIGLVPFAAAGLLAAVAGLLGGGLAVSVFVFVTVALLGRWVVRPALRSAEVAEVRAKPGTGSLIGKPAVVVERIANDEALGCVRIEEEIWSARSWDEDVIEPGARVHVVEMRGATAVVSA